MEIDLFYVQIYLGAFSFVCVVILVLFWCCRLSRIINRYLQTLGVIMQTVPLRGPQVMPLYSKYEVAGVYKDWQVLGGIKYRSVGIEVLPLPYIKIKLQPVIRYNLERLPNFTAIEKDRWLVFKVKHKLAWGIFDREYESFFSHDFIVNILERLVAVAEDLERGKKVEDIFS